MASRSTRAATKRGSYQKYTVKQRKAAVRDAASLGLAAAASKHGVPPSTLGNWAKAKRRSREKTKRPAEQGASAVTAKKLKEVAPRESPHPG